MHQNGMPKPLRRPRVLLVAYACSPYHGSEPGVGWNRAIQTAKYCDTWVVCEETRYGPLVRKYLDEHGDIPGLTFVFLRKSRLSRYFGRLPGMGYLSYRRWQWNAYQLVKRLHTELKLDLVHQVTFCSYREPGYLWKLDVPFVWGPVGGTQNYPWRFLAEAGFRGALREGMRSLLNNLQLRFSPRIRRALNRAAAVLAANSTIQRDLRSVTDRSADVLLETGITELRPRQSPINASFSLKILWSGELQPWKALSLLLKALALLPPELSYELRILGDGPLEKKWRRLADKLGIARIISWMGRLPHQEALDMCQWADVLAFSSLRDTSGNVVLEALAAGLPVLCLDHQGVHDIITDECGVKIPVTTPKEVAMRISKAIEELMRDPSALRRLSAGALARAEYYLWSRQGERMIDVYRDLVPALQFTEQADQQPQRETRSFTAVLP